MVYLDNAATTPCSEVAKAAVMQALECYGNPSSNYAIGQDAAGIVNRGREQVARAINAKPNEIYFTSGGSEGDNWGIKGLASRLWHSGKRHMITSSIEHHAVLHSVAALETQGFEVTYLPVTTDGFVDCKTLENAMREDTGLVCVMLANNEIGTIQPIQQLAAIAHKGGALFFTDAVQAVGHVPVDVKKLCVDYLSMSGHKFGAPKGIGALYCKRGICPATMIDGGAQENGHRAGTENTPGIAGIGAAIIEATENIEQNRKKVQFLRDYTIDRLQGIGTLNGRIENRLPGNINMTFGVYNELLLIELAQHGFCVSGGSACNSASLAPSHVLTAIGLDDNAAQSSLRITYGAQNTVEEAAAFCSAIIQIIARYKR